MRDRTAVKAGRRANVRRLSACRHRGRRVGPALVWVQWHPRRRALEDLRRYFMGARAPALVRLRRLGKGVTMRMLAGVDVETPRNHAGKMTLRTVQFRRGPSQAGTQGSGGSARAR